MKPATTKAAAAAILNHYADTAGLMKEDKRSIYGGQYKIETPDGPLYCYVSGYSIITSPDPLPGLEIIETKDQLNPYEYMRKAQEQARQDYHQPETPLNREALKAWKRTPEGKKHGFSIEDGPQRIGVSARYALDFMTIYPKALVFVAGPLDPIIFADPETLDQAGMIMPVNPSALLPRKEECPE